jgi:hypothetical protein
LQYQEARRLIKEVSNEQRPSRWSSLLVIDESDGQIALSVACALADVLSLQRTAIFYENSPHPPVKVQPPNEFVATRIREARVGML